MYRRRLLKCYLGLFILTVFLWLALAPPLYAAPVQGDQVILGDDLTLREDEHIDGDLVLMGGDLVMEAGSRVEGSVTAFGGRVAIDGTVPGDVVAFGGDVALGAHARVGGEVIALGGQVHREAGAQTGRVVEGGAIPSKLWEGVRGPFFSRGIGLRPRSILGVGLATFMSALFMTALGIAVVTFWPTQTAQVGQTILTAPLPSLGAGCALYPLAASLTFFVLITLCLAPFAPFVVLLLVTSSLFGWIALGTLWGRWLVRRIGWSDATLLATAGVGVFSLTIVAVIAGVVPCLGVLLVLGATSIGLGAVALSRFGTSRYQRRPVD